MLTAIRDEFGLAADAEVTTEANPESVDPAYLAALREGGFNRISFGMQSARQHVLKVLDRTHTPGRPEACVAEARAAGFDHVNLDLIYGTPGESDDDWRASLDAAVGAGPDHVSAYALIVEEGTQLARRIRRGEVPMTDDDVHADRYLIAEEPCRRRASPGTRCRTGRPRTPGAACTTSCTGAAPTGGARAPARTPTWAGCAGGTSSTPARTRRPWRRAARRARAGSCCRTRTGGWSGSCWNCGWRRASRCPSCGRTAWRPPSGRSGTGCSARPRTRRAGRP